MSDFIVVISIPAGAAARRWPTGKQDGTKREERCLWTELVGRASRTLGRRGVFGCRRRSSSPNGTAHPNLLRMGVQYDQ